MLGKRGRRPRLAIVGASARAAASAARRAGFGVVAADLFADADLARCCTATHIADYPDGFADWLARQQVDAWTYTGALENHPDLVDRMAGLRPLWGNRGDPLRRCRDPMELRRLLGDRGLPFPKTRRERAGLPLDGSWLCKSYRGACGSGVWRLDSQAAATRADRADAVFQQHVDAPPASAVYACGVDRFELLLLSEQLVGLEAWGAAPFRYCGSVHPARGPSTNQARDLHEIGAVVCGKIGLRGVVGVDVLLIGDRVMAIEVNPRLPASIDLCDHGGRRALMLHHAQPFAESPPATFVSPERRPPVGKAIVYAKSDLTVDAAFHSWAMSEATGGRLADAPHAGTAIRTGHPVCTLLAPPPTRGVLQRLGTRVEDVYRRLAGSPDNG